MQAVVVFDVRGRLWVRLLGFLRGFPACGSPPESGPQPPRTLSETDQSRRAGVPFRDGTEDKSSVSEGVQHRDEEELCLHVVGHDKVTLC